MHDSIGKRTAHNSFYSLLANGCYLLSRFLLTPFTLHFLSLEEYGLWSLCFVVMSFLALTSMGFEGTYVKYVAEFQGGGHYSQVNRLLSTGLVISSLLAVFFMFALYFLMPFLLTILHIEKAWHEKASLLFLGTGLVFTIDISLNCFGRALDGIQQIGLTSKVRLGTIFVELILIVFFLLLGYGIYGLLAAFIIRYLLAIIINTYYAFKLIPRLSIRLGYLDFPSLKLLCSYGGKMQILGFIGIFMSTFDRLIITRLLGLGMAGMYEVGRKLPATGASIPAVISGVMVPALSHLQGMKELSKARKLFLEGSRYMAMISAFLFSYLFITAPWLISFWLGAGYEAAVGVMQIMTVGVFVNLLTGTSSALSKGFAKLDLELKYASMNMLLCLLMTPLLTLQFGLVGTALGVAGSTVIASIWFIGMTNIFFKVSLLHYFKMIGHPLLVILCSAAGLFLLLSQFVVIEQSNRMLTGLILLAVALVHLLLSALLLFMSHGLIQNEVQWFQKKILSRWGLLRNIS